MSYEKVRQLQSRIIIGTKQTIKAIKNGDVQEVFVAVDADERVTKEVVEVAKQFGVSYTEVNSKKELGQACAIDVDASTVAITNE